ncbi:MAG TPA: putative baseplate assembly protein [Fimbriimonadaceae bacterium]|nr:putative baseplate assembly protein [Fimbriimonadaceae bacterium]
MALPAPNLDDRKFQDIVDEVKRRIVSRCPEWTEHNVSDPGVTLIELFAGIADMMLYRFNQIPEKNFVKYLELIGVRLVPQKAATTNLRFRLVRPLVHGSSDSNDFILPAFGTTVGTPRTETEDAIEFSTVEDLVVRAPRISHVLMVPSSVSEDEFRKGGGQLVQYDIEKYAANIPDQVLISEDRKQLTEVYFPVFGAEIAHGNALYVAFDESVASHILEIQVDGLTGAAPKLRPENPLQVWEYWSSVERIWRPLEVLRDSLAGFNVMEGSIEVAVPYDSDATTVGGSTAHWIRCRYTTQLEDLPDYIQRGLRIDPYVTSPRVRNLRVYALGGTAEAAHCMAIFNEVIGESDGLPGQIFKLANGPTLDLEPEEFIEVCDPVDGQGRSVWQRVEDFSESEEASRHFTFDPILNEVTFGPAIRQPDGRVLQHGAIPAKGYLIRLSRYRIGGGIRGNLAQGALRVLKESRAVASVINVTPAIGGQDRETLERAKLRAVGILKVRDRAVTRDDFSYLACQVSGVERAACIVPGEVDSKAGADKNSQLVQVLLIPTLPPNCLAPEPSQLAMSEQVLNRAQQHLELRKLLTTLVEVRQPDYVYVSTQIQFVANGQADPEQVASNIESELFRFIHPVYGGFDRTGWPFGKALTVADIYAAVSSVWGVAFLTSVRVFTSRAGHDGLRSTPQETDLRSGVVLGPTEMFASRQHTISATQQWMVQPLPPSETERV